MLSHSLTPAFLVLPSPLHALAIASVGLSLTARPTGPPLRLRNPTFRRRPRRPRRPNGSRIRRIGPGDHAHACDRYKQEWCGRHTGFLVVKKFRNYSYGLGMVVMTDNPVSLVNPPKT